MEDVDPEPVESAVDSYFTSYEDLEVHELMLKDEPRTLAYARYMEQNPSVIRDKIVVDVGAGTGILSLLAARAGAKHVYAIEASNVAKICEEIVEQNGLQDKVTVLQTRVEEATLPEGIRADVLVSEWMGFYLLHESMLASVLQARDRLLKQDGVILPSTAALYLCPVSMVDFYKDKFQFWNKVYGFDFSPVLPHVKARTMSQPQIVTLDPSQCLAEPELVMNLDLRYMEPEDVTRILGHFNFKLTKNGVLHGFACWFDVGFVGEDTSTLDTGPKSPATHWKQTVILMPDALLVSKDEDVECYLKLTQCSDHRRRYDICIEVPEEVIEEEDDDEYDDVGGDGDMSPSGEHAENLILSAMQR